jgi:hypothetical protein
MIDKVRDYIRNQKNIIEKSFGEEYEEFIENMDSQNILNSLAKRSVFIWIHGLKAAIN